MSSAKILVFLFEKIYVRVSISLARALSKLEKNTSSLHDQQVRNARDVVVSRLLKELESAVLFQSHILLFEREEMEQC